MNVTEGPASDADWIAIERSLARIEELEPTLLALLPERDRRSRLQRDFAAAASAHDEHHRLPLLHRLFGVKDVIRVDGFETQAGSALPPHEFAGSAASCVERLRAAGGVVLGKTVTAEFACRDPGATANPHNPRHTPGGSSSGSAAAVAAGYCEAALGTQTIASIIRPAAYCGVVGYKPTYGRVPTDGVIPYAPSVDCVGLLAKDVEATMSFARHLVPDWRGPVSPRRCVLVPSGSLLRRPDLEVRTRFDRQLEQLTVLGIQVEECAAWENFDEVAQHATSLTDFEFAAVHRDWFTVYGPFYRPISSAVYLRGLATTVNAHSRAREFQLKFRASLQETMESRGAEAWLSPAALGPAPEGLESTGDPTLSLPWTFAGLPILSLPAGRAQNGLPLGLQFAGRFGSDEELCTLASLLEGRLDGCSEAGFRGETAAASTQTHTASEPSH